MGEMICPECMGALASTDGKSARCTVHGGTYKVLFWRGMTVAASTGLPAGSAAIPPVTQAPVAGQALDSPATYPSAPTVMAAPDQFLATTAAAFPSPAANATGGPVCYLHRQVPAALKCNTCGLPICQTCDFAFPMNIEKPSGVLGLGSSSQIAFHMCPRCASSPRQTIDAPRKKYLVWSYVLAVWSTLALVALFVLAPMMHTKADLDSMGAVMGNLIIWPSLIGTALGAAAKDRRLANPFSVKVPLIWNGAILALFVLLCIIGLMK